jgi:tetratricopeptide (TPR) repeat protein
VYFENASRAALLARQMGDAEFEDDVGIFETYGTHLVGRLAESLALCERVIARGMIADSERAFGIDTYVWHRQMRAENCMHMGRFPEALTFAAEALEAARARDEFECEIWTNNLTGNIHAWICEDAEAALRYGRRALELAENVGSPVNRALARFGFSFGAIAGGLFEEAVEACEEALAIVDETGAGGIWRSWCLANLSEAYAGLGDYANARERAEQGLERARACGVPVWEADSAISLARALLLSGDGDHGAIEDALDRADELIGVTGANARLLPLMEVRAGLAKRGGDSEALARAVAKTRSLYSEMSATGREARLVQLIAD